MLAGNAPKVGFISWLLAVGLKEGDKCSLHAPNGWPALYGRVALDSRPHIICSGHPYSLGGGKLHHAQLLGRVFKL